MHLKHTAKLTGKHPQVLDFIDTIEVVHRSYPLRDGFPDPSNPIDTPKEIDVVLTIDLPKLIKAVGLKAVMNATRVTRRKDLGIVAKVTGVRHVQK